MIGKIIWMKQRTHDVRNIQADLFALTRYVVDANPYLLAALAHDEIMSLSDYALAIAGTGAEPGEKVEDYGAINLVGDSLPLWQTQMLAIAALATRSRNLVIHIVISLPEHEQWSEQQREEAIDIVTNMLGLQNCPHVWAGHGNTKNPHLHLASVCVDRETGKAAGTGWLIDDLHQALAVIEERQGRRPEPNALYVARDGAVFDTETGTLVRDQMGKFQSGWYLAKGVKHYQVPDSVRELTPAIRAVAQTSENWAELHQGLQSLNVHYNKKGNGARIAVGSSDAKASDVHHDLALPQLVERLGEFEADQSRVDQGFETYRRAFQKQLDGLRADRERNTAQLKQWSAAVRATLPEHAPPIVGKAITAERDAAMASLNSAYSLAIKACTDTRLTVDAWRAAGKPAYPPPVPRPALILPAVQDGVERAQLMSVPFVGTPVDWGTEYRDDGGALMFVDHRTVIVVAAVQNCDAIDAALKLAASRWGRITITGSDAFVRLANERAQHLGIEAVGGTKVEAERPTSASTEAPKELPAPEQPLKPQPEPVKPAPDPARDERVMRLLELLEPKPFVPVRRLPATQQYPTGALEIVLQGAGFYNRLEIELVAVFDQDPRVQEFLEKKHAQNLQSIERRLSNLPPEKLKGQPKELLELLLDNQSMHAVATLAMHSRDYLELLERARQEAERRAKQLVKDQAAERETPTIPQPPRRSLSQLESQMNSVLQSQPDALQRRNQIRDEQWIRERGREEE